MRVMNEFNLGLTEAEAALRLKNFGANETPSQRRKPLFQIVGLVLREPMIFLLVACGVIYLLIGERQDAVLLLFSIFFIVLINVYQERRSQRALEALREISSPRALVIRSGQEIKVAGRDVVPGDIIVISEGDRVPADAVVLDSSHLHVDESLITGESFAVAKAAGLPPSEKSTLIGSTLVTSGRAIARVLQTGPRSAVGKIGKSLHDDEHERTRLQLEISKIVKRFGILGIAFCSVIALAYGLIRGDWPSAVLAGLASAMALLPEEFPVVLTIFLSLGAWRLSRLRVLVRQPAATENLGAITALCVDKTGTLTHNKMSISGLSAWRSERSFIDTWTTESLAEDFHELVEFAALASHRDPFDPMEKAILGVLGSELSNTEHIHQDWVLQKEYPLSPELLAMSCVWQSRERQSLAVAVKGAPEAIVELCRFHHDTKQLILKHVSELSERGLRVIAVAKSEFSGGTLPIHQSGFQFSFLGLIGLSDPVRSEVPAAIAECHAAGIRVIMITGDYPGTALKVAREIGLYNPDRVLLGADVDRMNDLELKEEMKRINVFARMVPAQKLRIVNALKSIGEVVGMTGDGVNDAPSLKWADVGIAMGGRGTDVAREAADLVLIDDDFSSIVRAIRHGRRIFENIRSAMAYIFAVHVPIAGLAITPILFGWPLILLPIHIVFLEMVIDPSCTLVFEAASADPESMKRPPRNLSDPLFGIRDITRSGTQGLVTFAALIGLYYGSMRSGHTSDQSRAIAFSAFVFGNIGLIMTSRGVFLKSLFSNRFFWLVALIATAVLVIVHLTPSFRQTFHFGDLKVSEILLAACVSALPALSVILFGRRSAANSTDPKG